MFAPFSGLLFDPDRVRDRGAVTCPPYDVIDEDARRRYLAASPYNVVRLLLSERTDARYQAASRLLAEWRREGILRPDPAPRFYLYHMEHLDDHGTPWRAEGVIGALDLDPDDQPILPHEETGRRARADRLAALRATRTNLDPIVVLSPAPELESLLEPPGPPRLAFSGERVEHRLYDLSAPDLQEAIVEAVSSHPLTIADGHHRFATALQYREERRSADGPGPWDAIMAFLAPVDGGLSVGSIHRLFETAPELDPSRLEDAFQVREAAAEPPLRPGELVVVTGQDPDRRCLALRPRSAVLRSLPVPWRSASAAVARELLYPRLGIDESRARYEPDIRTALDRLDGLPHGMVVLAAPVPAQAIVAALDQGIRFPQKSTFFHPKPRAGLVLRPLDPVNGSAS